jgi:hypothetical protein
MDHYRTGRESKIRGKAVQYGHMKPMWCENDFVDGIDPVAPKYSVASELISIAIATRRVATEALADEVATPENIKELLLTEKKWFNANDVHWKVDNSFWTSLTGEHAKVRITGMVLKALPSPNAYLTLGDSKRRLAALLDSKMVSYGGASWGKVVKLVIGYIDALASGQEPAFKTNGNDFLTKVQLAMANFCHIPAGAASSASVSAVPALFGKAAAKTLLVALKVSSAANPKLPWEQITSVSRFGWLFGKAELTEIATIKKKCTSSCIRKASGIVETASSESKVPKKDTKSMVRAMFG